MKNVTNVEFTLEDVKQKTSYFELIIQAVKTPSQEGLGDLEEQMQRMAILAKVKKAKEAKVEFIELEDAEAKALTRFQINVKYAILDENLIAYQKLIKEL